MSTSVPGSPLEVFPAGHSLYLDEIRFASSG